MLAGRVVWEDQGERAQDVGEFGAGEAVEVSNEGVEFVAQALASESERRVLSGRLL